ncbi:MAG: pyridoxal phosphate-dependent decarboxylase family protein, partial [Thermoanaerobaculia bacterium]
IEPNVTHWNHPGFLAYFAITGSAPGIVAEALSAALNVNAMLWRTAPAATELEERVCDWLRQMLGLPEAFRGHLNDTASIGTLLALAVARERAGLDVRERGLAGRPELPTLVVYASDQAHSSVDKAVLTLGLGLENLRRVGSDERFRLDPGLLERAILEDRLAGRLPLAVVATAGTTSSTSVDPLEAVGEVAARHRLWFHVDAAYAGSAAVCPELQPLFAGWEWADSIVVNPHKWLFVPFDCSALYVRDVGELKRTFSLVPEYLTSPEGEVTNLMDLGIQLGRKFRALKLWMVIRAFGVEGLREAIREHCRLARLLAERIASHPDFEVVAPVPFSVVCFRWTPPGAAAEQDAANERLLAAVNAAGPVFLSHTRLAGRYVLRVAIGNLKTTQEHIERAWGLVREAAARLGAGA